MLCLVLFSVLNVGESGAPCLDWRRRKKRIPGLLIVVLSHSLLLLLLIKIQHVLSFRIRGKLTCGRTHCNFVGSASHLRSASIGVNSLEKFKSAIFLARRGIYKNFDTHMLFPNSPCKYARIFFSPSGKAQCVCCIRSGRPKCYFFAWVFQSGAAIFIGLPSKGWGQDRPVFCPLSKACIETDERRNSFSLIAPHRPRTSYEVTGEVAQFWTCQKKKFKFIFSVCGKWSTWTTFLQKKWRKLANVRF